MPEDFTCALPAEPDAAALVEFLCPRCARSVFEPLNSPNAKLLMLLGAGRAQGPAPLELTEEKSGPHITLDDLLDLHAALESICCPQEHLIGGPR
jgi:hypothetical protein